MKHSKAKEGPVNGVQCYSEAELQEVINTYSLPASWGVVSQGQHFLLSALEAGGEVMLPEYQAILDYATAQGFTKPSAAQQSEQNSLVAALIDAGIWDKLDVFYNFLTDGSADFAKINWRNPGTYQCLSVGATPFTTNDGFKSGGAAQYLNTQAAFSSLANFKQDNGSLGMDLTIPTLHNVIDMGAVDGSRYAIIMAKFHTDNLNYNWVNSQSAGGVANPNSPTGLYVSQRNIAQSQNCIRNGEKFGQINSVSVAPPSLPCRILNVTSGISTATAHMAFIGDALTGLESALYNAWKAYANPIKAAAAYKAIIDYATAQLFTLPSAPQQAVQEQLILDMINADIWDKLDVFYNFLTDGSAGFAKINWKNPGAFQAITPAQVSFTANSGFTHSGSAGTSINIQWNPTVNGINYALNNASYFFDKSNGVTGSTFDYWVGSPSAITKTNNLGGQLGAGINGPVIQSGAIGNFIHVKRTGAGLQSYFSNGVSVYTDSASTSTSKDNINLPVLLGAGTPIGLQCVGFGASLTGLEAALYNAWTLYKNEVLKEISYKAVIDYATAQGFTLPSVGQQAEQKILLDAMIDAGIWQKLDVFYNFFTDGDANFAKINWKKPGTYQAVGTGHEPTFIPNSGFKGNGSSQYLDTGWAPSNGVLSVQNDASYFCQIDELQQVSQFLVGSAVGGTRLYQLYQSASIMQYMINDGTYNTGTYPGVSSFLHASRIPNGNEIRLFKNGTRSDTFNSGTSTPSTVTVLLLARHESAIIDTFSPSRIGCFGAGASLSGLESALYNVWTTYKANA